MASRHTSGAARKNSQGPGQTSTRPEPLSFKSTRERARTSEIREVNERLLISALREREHAEAASHQTAQMSALLESMAEGVIVMNAKGEILLMNKAGLAIFGLDAPPPTIEGLRMLDMREVDGSLLDFEDRPVRRAARGESFVDKEVVFRRNDGENRHLLTSGNAVFGREGGAALALVVFHDVTGLRALEQRQKDCVALISHDLRTPLTSIQLGAQQLERRLAGHGLEQDQRTAQRIASSAKRMNALIEDLLYSARLELGNLELRRVPVDLGGLVASIIEQMPSEAARFRVECLEPVPPVLVDPERINRALINLVTNALKFSSPEMPVVIRIARAGDHALVSVIDHGVGIPRADIPRLFERFYRATTRSQVEGIGLGLYIVRLLVAAHGGRISVESEVGKGSCFTVELPLA